MTKMVKDINLATGEIEYGEGGGGATVEVGTTTTLPAGSNATVTNSGTETDVVLNFGIPQGIKGDTGAQGPQGAQGPKGDTGAGVPNGGTTGQFLVKNSNTDQDTKWATPSPRLGYDTVNGVTYISIIED